MSGASSPTILDRIVAATKEQLARRKRETPVADLRERALYSAPRRDLVGALRARSSERVPALIAEIKKASPSQGLIRPDFDPLEIAVAYRDAGAAAISVLTEEASFQGSLSHLERVRAGVPNVPPLLRKDFIVDSYQLEEARAAGADAVLLIVAILDDAQLRDLYLRARDLDLAVLVEAYDERETERALKLRPRLLGINNRDLRTFEVDLRQTERAFAAVRAAGYEEEVLLVSESGIAGHADALRLRQLGAEAILVGEHLMRRPDVRAAVRELLG